MPVTVPWNLGGATPMTVSSLPFDADGLPEDVRRPAEPRAPESVRDHDDRFASRAA